MSECVSICFECVCMLTTFCMCVRELTAGNWLPQSVGFRLGRTKPWHIRSEEDVNPDQVLIDKVQGPHMQLCVRGASCVCDIGGKGETSVQHGTLAMLLAIRTVGAMLLVLAAAGGMSAATYCTPCGSGPLRDIPAGCCWQVQVNCFFSQAVRCI